MKSFTVATILFSITASADAAPYARSENSGLGKGDALADCGTNQACITVVNTINSWTSFVNTVNQFLNDPTLDPNLALATANLEPSLLATLGGTAG